MSRTFALLAAVAIMALAGGRACAQTPNMALVLIIIGNTPLRVELPHTGPQRYLGLSGRAALAPGHGMAFVMNPAHSPTMTMRGMRFALDFIWTRQGQVVEVTPGVPPGGNPPQDVWPSVPVDLVVEAPAGWARQHAIGPGSPVRLSSVLRRVETSSLDTLINIYGAWPAKAPQMPPR